ncbi:cupin domain-containing protein, partial [Methylobacterium radiotolerans]|uniref:cupin domain-containing protein n=1 Tax=Methylobacterium radiotolerans TaxID=31998 RepID=UPI001FDAC5F2
AEALGVTFSRLMAPATEREILLIPASRQPILRDEASGYLRRCISPVLPGRGIDWVLNTLPPGASTCELTAHHRGVSEHSDVLRGRLQAVIGERAVLMETGDSPPFQADRSRPGPPGRTAAVEPLPRRAPPPARPRRAARGP